MLHQGLAPPSSAPWRDPKKAGYHGFVPDSRLDELWSDVLGRWTDEEAHLAFIEHCRVGRHLDEAARRYVEASRRPETYRNDGRPDEVAQMKLKLIAALATVDLEKSRSETEARGRAIRSRLWTYRMVLLALVIIGVIVGLASRR
jgi:hypothetical protein